MAVTTGNFETVSAADLLNDIVQSRKVGVLSVARYQQVRIIVMTHSDIGIINDGIGAILQLGEILLAKGYLTEEALSKALNYQKETPDKRLGSILIEKGMVTQKHIDEATQFQVEEQIFEMLTWREANFEFSDENPVEYLKQHKGLVIHVQPSKILLQAINSYEKWPKIERRLPTPWLTFKETEKTTEKSSALSEVQRTIIRCVHEGRTIETIVQQVGAERLKTYDELTKLLEKGFILPTPITDLRFLASEHRSRKRYIDALNIYRRLLQSSELPSEQREIEGLIYETIEAIEITKHTKESASVSAEDSNHLHTRAARARRRRRIKTISQWALFISLVLFFFIFAVLYNISLHKTKTEARQHAALPPVTVNTQPQPVTVEAAPALTGRLGVEIDDASRNARFGDLYDALVLYAADSPDPKIRALLNDRYADAKKKQIASVNARMASGFVGVINERPDFAALNEALRVNRQSRIGDQASSLPVEDLRAAIASHVAGLPPYVVLDVFSSMLDSLSLTQIETASRVGRAELDALVRDRNALIAAARVFEPKAVDAQFQKDLTFNAETLNVMALNSEGKSVPATQILPSDVFASNWQVVAGALRKLDSARLKKILIRNANAVRRFAAQAKAAEQTGDTAQAQAYWRQALLASDATEVIRPSLDALKTDKTNAEWFDALSNGRLEATDGLRRIEERRQTAERAFASAIAFAAQGDILAAADRFGSILTGDADPLRTAAMNLKSSLDSRRVAAEALLKTARESDPGDSISNAPRPDQATRLYRELLRNHGDWLSAIPSPQPDQFKTAYAYVSFRLDALAAQISSFNQGLDVYRADIQSIRNDLKRMRPDDTVAQRRIDGRINRAVSDLNALLASDRNATGFLRTQTSDPAYVPVRVQSCPSNESVEIRKQGGKEWTAADVKTPGWLFVPFGEGNEMRIVKSGWRSQSVTLPDSAFNRPDRLSVVLLASPQPTVFVELNYRGATADVSAPPAILTDGSLVFPTSNSALIRVKASSSDSISVSARYPVVQAIGAQYFPSYAAFGAGEILVASTPETLTFIDPSTGRDVQWTGWERAAGSVRGLGKAMASPLVCESYASSGTPFACWVNQAGEIGVYRIRPGGINSDRPMLSKPMLSGAAQPETAYPSTPFAIGNDNLGVISESRDSLIIVKRANPGGAGGRKAFLGGPLLVPGDALASTTDEKPLFGPISLHQLADGPGAAPRFLAGLTLGMRRVVALIEIPQTGSAASVLSQWNPAKADAQVQAVYPLKDVSGDRNFAVAYIADDAARAAGPGGSSWLTPEPPVHIMLLEIDKKQVMYPAWKSENLAFGSPLPPVAGRVGGRDAVFIVTRSGRLYAFDIDRNADLPLIDGVLDHSQRGLGAQFAFPAPGGGLGVVTNDNRVLFFYP